MIVSGKQFFGGQPGKVVQPANAPTLNIPSKEERKSLWESLKSAVADSAVKATRDVVSDVKESAGKRVEGVKKSVERLRSGEQGVKDTVAQYVGQGAGFVGDVAGSAIVRGAQAITPDQVEKAIVEKGKQFLETPTGQKALEVVGQGMEAYNSWKSEHPVDAANLEAIVNVASLIPIGKGAKIVKEGAEAAVTAGVDVVKEGAEAVVGVGVKAMDATADAARSAVKGVDGKGVSGVIEKVVAKPVPKPVETVLREIPATQFDEYADVARKATLSYKNATPLEMAGKKAQKALDTVQRKLNAIGTQKGSVMAKAAVGNKPMGNIVVKFRQSLDNFLKGKTAVEGDSKLIKDVMLEAKRLGDNPAAKDVDKFIDFVQDRIYTGGRDLSVPITDETTASLRKIVGELNESLKSQLPESYRGLNGKYSKIVDIRNELNLKLGKEGEKGGSLMKRVFSPSDARTKELFQEVKDLTGVDLVNEATLARFVMEALGDARQTSLLEQLQLPSSVSPSGFLDYLRNKAVEGFNKPEDILRRAREMTVQ